MVLIRKAAFWIAYGGEHTYDFLSDGTAITLLYEWRKDVLTYFLISGVVWTWDRFQAAVLRDSAPAPAGDQPMRLKVRDGARITYVPTADVCWIEAAGNYVELHTASQTHLVRGTLAAFEAKLSGAGFVRVHRSRLVNRARIRSLATTEAGDFTVTFDDGRSVGASRRFRTALAVSRTPGTVL